MKKVILLLITLFAMHSIVMAQTGTQRPALSRSNRYSQGYGQKVTWHKKIVTGVTSLYTRGTVNPTINGASDSLFSDCYYNHGKNSVQFDFIVDATPSAFTVYIEVLTANIGDYAITDAPDSLFKTKWWLKKGTGGSANIISTAKDSIITVGKTGPMELYLGSDEWFKFLVISSPIASDINTVKAHLNRQER